MTKASQDISETKEPEDAGGGWTVIIAVSFLGMVLVQEYTSLGYTSISIALPEISSHFSTTQGGWLLTSFLLTGAVVSPLLGKMADIFGKRKILLLALGIAATGAVIAAMAPNMSILLFGRCLEGFSLAGMFLSHSLMRDIFPKNILPFANSPQTAFASRAQGFSPPSSRCWWALYWTISGSVACSGSRDRARLPMPHHHAQHPRDPPS